MNKIHEELKADIEKINDDTVIEKIFIYIAGILAQQRIEANYMNDITQTKNDKFDIT